MSPLLGRAIAIVGACACLLVGACSTAGGVQATAGGPGSAEAWALASDALPIEELGLDHHRLDAVGADPQVRQQMLGALRRDWHVNSRAQLLQALAWLEDHGHRERFDEMGAEIDVLNADQFKQKLYYAEDPDQLATLALVRGQYQRLGQKSILAWDLGRFVTLARLGYQAGLLSEDESWAQILRVSARLHQSFSSWKDLGDDYLVGREFWSQEDYAEHLPRTDASFAFLLHDPSSPWKQTRWNIDPAEFARACARHLNCQRLQPQSEIAGRAPAAPKGFVPGGGMSSSLSEGIGDDQPLPPPRPAPFISGALTFSLGAGVASPLGGSVLPALGSGISSGLAGR